MFLVEDEEMQLMALKHYLEQKFESKLIISTFLSGEACLENITQKPDIVVLDYNLDKNNSMAFDGIQVLKAIKKYRAGIEVIMLSGQEKMEIAVETMKYGAFDYVIKSDSAYMRLELLLQNAIRKIVMKRQLMIQKAWLILVTLLLCAIIILWIAA